MAIRILYFAALREALGTASEELPGAVTTVAELRRQLLERGGAWEALAEGRSLRVAVNQRMAEPASRVRDGDEVAFFPPVTGG
jgi:molybdopterin synthase sulfur carrier subunit